MTFGDRVVAYLKRAGCQAMFGVPGGGGNLDLIEAAESAGLPFVLTATETAGALAAVAQAEITGNVGACLTTLGPGAASVVNGVACALLDRAPLVVFTDAAAGGAGGPFAHQQIDQAALFAPITKWSGPLTPDSAERTLARALSAAMAPPPGPVHLDCFADRNAAEEGTLSFSAETAHKAQKKKEKGTVPFTVVQRSRKPVVVVGLGARDHDDAAAVLRFVERRGVPAMVTYKAKGVVPDSHPCFAGVFTHAAIERPLLDQSDLIIGVGLDPVELLPRPWAYPQPAVYVGRWPVPDSHIPFVAQQVTGIPAGLAEIDALLGATDWDLSDTAAHVESLRQAIAVPAEGLTAQRAVVTAAAVCADRPRVTVDAGAHMFAATMLWPVAEPNGLLISNGLSTMGFALPAAIGAALLDRHRPVVALTGDGGLMMCAAELLTAAREKLHVITVVFNDASLSLIEIKQQMKRYRPAGVRLGPVKWARIAEGFGLAAFSASTEAELRNALEAALSIDGPSVIDVTIDGANYPRTMETIRG